MSDGDIDAGLLLLSTMPAPGNRPWTHDEIAYVCGCSRSYIWLLEKSGIKKLRREITRRGLRKEFLRLVA